MTINTLSMISLLVMIVLLMSMLAQARPWTKLKMPGKVIKTLPIGFFQRVNFHRSSLLALALGIIMARVTGWLPVSIAVFTAGFALAILCMPMQYTFTTQGVAVGQAVFRPWKEFTDIKTKQNHIVLEHASFFGRLTLFVRPVEFESVLKFIHKSYS